jgi:alpha-amylase/alpha-mannosidase (GH57 family)
MHQPQYRDQLSGVYHLPWTYLHATKDYVDMAAHLEANPDARAVVNFAPVLLDEIVDYAEQVAAFLSEARPIQDPLLNALANPLLPEEPAERMVLAEACLKANEKRLIDPYPKYRELADMVAWLRERPTLAGYMNDQFLGDLLVWYHLVWVGETVRRSDPRVERLLEQGAGYALADRRLLLEIIGELLGGVVGRYKALADQGRVELSMTPYAHPIMPLLLQIESAREAMPDVLLPTLSIYPGGEERVRWHIERGIETFERHFGRRPEGCWPSEGSVSEATLKLLEEYGLRWTASGETVLANSLRASGESELPSEKQWLHRPYRLDGGKLLSFFRDDGLSDSIGFRYSDWHADDAIANFVHNLEAIADQCADDPCSVVSVILDGENAWEYYPANGYYLLSGLYKALAEHPDIELTTFAESIRSARPGKLKTLVAGSWVYGTFSTWIGDRDKNLGWDMLGDAKNAFDRAVREGRLAGDHLAQAVNQLAICEGSDWCWWFGDYNPSTSVSDFERLYRRHLANLYQLIGEPPPDYLSHAFTHGGGAPATGGVMRQGQLPIG